MDKHCVHCAATIGYPQKTVDQHAATARSIRCSIMKMLTRAKCSHMGCSFSLTDILTILYHHVVDPGAIIAQDPERDRVILSKGHSASALYATLASVGIIEPEQLDHYYEDGTLLGGHPIKGLRGVEAGTGSLGHGLSLAVGLAYAGKVDGSSRRHYVVVGDGECQEGSVWEAVFTAARLKLNNLVLVVDYNNLQGLDKSDDIMPGSFVDKFTAFGWQSWMIDGHDISALMHAFDCARDTQKPTALVARTCKGKGVSFIENKIMWHYKSFSEEQYQAACKELVQR